MLTILWHDKESAGYTDCIPLNLFESEGEKKNFIHDVTGPRGGHYHAKCDVKVEKETAELDYTKHPDFNNKAGMILGVLKIVFTSSERFTVSCVLWKCDEEEFKVYPVTVNHLEIDVTVSDASDGFQDAEGRLRLQIHLTKERSKKLVKAFKDKLRDYSCSVCGFSFEKKYGDIGHNYIEAHHKIPISKLTEETTITTDDLVAVCANCHRMLHRSNAPSSPSELKELLKRGRLGVNESEPQHYKQ